MDSWLAELVLQSYVCSRYYAPVCVYVCVCVCARPHTHTHQKRGAKQKNIQQFSFSSMKSDPRLQSLFCPQAHDSWLFYFHIGHIPLFLSVNLQTLVSKTRSSYMSSFFLLIGKHLLYCYWCLFSPQFLIGKFSIAKDRLVLLVALCSVNLFLSTGTWR